MSTSFPNSASKLPTGLVAPLHRRAFLRYTGAGLAVTGLLLAGCDDDTNMDTNPDTGLVDVGSGDVGVLNYAYALEQLEAAFYTEVLKGTYYSGATTAEKQIWQDLFYHETIHRDFLNKAITAAGGTPIRDLKPDFTKINFNDKTSVLSAAKTFEDTGVAAYNGAGKLIQSADYLTIAGKIVSVEARHSALIRDIIQNGTFVDSTIVNLSTGTEISKNPPDIAAAVAPYLMEGSKLDVSKLPTE